MRKIIVFSAAALCIAANTMINSADIQHRLSDSLIRMHIIANSNTLYDQNIKLSVRDRLSSEAKNGILPQNLERAACDELNRIGAEYTASVSYEHCYVPHKRYKSMALPEGMYNCVRVVLGEGKGENWWCVAYPPLCYTESMFGGLTEDGKSKLEAVLDEEAMKTIINDGGINFRLKTVEIMQKIRRQLQS